MEKVGDKSSLVSLNGFTFISGGNLSVPHLISCKQSTSGFSYSKNSRPPFFSQARNPSTFHVDILKFQSWPFLDFWEQVKSSLE